MEDKIYKTVLGDTWDNIAYKLYGDSKKFEELMDYNQEYVDTLVFSAGAKIRYKPKTASDIKQENVAPWRR